MHLYHDSPAGKVFEFSAISRPFLAKDLIQVLLDVKLEKFILKNFKFLYSTMAKRMKADTECQQLHLAKNKYVQLTTLYVHRVHLG